MIGLKALLTDSVDTRWTWFLVLKVTGLINIH